MSKAEDEFNRLVREAVGRHQNDALEALLIALGCNIQNIGIYPMNLGGVEVGAIIAVNNAVQTLPDEVFQKVQELLSCLDKYANQEKPER
jgi:hypothetical protein